MNSDDHTTMGLRERKKRRTRLTIQQHAMRLFREQGYAETTIEQIAEAAEISPSTFFRYFKTKEDVVLTDEYDMLLVEVFLNQPKELNTIQAIRRSFQKVFKGQGNIEMESENERSKLIMNIPELRAAALNNAFPLIRIYSEAIAARKGLAPDDRHARISAGALFGVAMAVFAEWMESDDMNFYDAFDETIAILENGLSL